VWQGAAGRGPVWHHDHAGGDVYYASLAGNHIARIDVETGDATVIEPPTKEQGARRVWSDSQGRIWVSYWNTGHVGMYDPACARMEGVEASRAKRTRIRCGSTARTRCG
jgi:virginiamycin B lyase